MDKIRIGNDIRLKVSLKDSKTGGLVNIRHLHAIIVNTTEQRRAQERLQKKTRFISRYPVEPMLDEFTATVSNLNNSGYPTYRVMPGSYRASTYAGFGIYPDWKDIYRPCKKYNLYEYSAPVIANGDSNIIDVYFPADAQLYTGIYKLIIIAQIYAPGYYKNNIRTITIDYNGDDNQGLFELVDSSWDTDSDMTIEVDQEYSEAFDNYLESATNDNGMINYTLLGGEIVKLDLTKELEWGERE